MAASAAMPGWRRPIHRLRFELMLSWRFNAGDVPAGTVPGLISTAAAWALAKRPAGELPWDLTRALIYFWLFLLIHTLSNQATGAAEDRRNKPHRPIPAGLVTAEGAAVRFTAVAALFLWAGWLFRVEPWALAWFSLVTVHNYLGSDRFWPTKNLHTIIGSLVQNAAAWQMVAPLSPGAWRWIIAGTAYWSIVFIQDLRDIPGDRGSGRRTLPMILGTWPTRIILAAAFLILPVLAQVFLVHQELCIRTSALVWDVVFALTNWHLAVRILLHRTPSADHATYQRYCWLWCWLLTAPLLIHGY